MDKSEKGHITSVFSLVKTQSCGHLEPQERQEKCSLPVCSGGRKYIDIKER